MMSCVLDGSQRGETAVPLVTHESVGPLEHRDSSKVVDAEEGGMKMDKVTMQDVARIMRVEDAALLEAMHNQRIGTTTPEESPRPFEQNSSCHIKGLQKANRSTIVGLDADFSVIDKDLSHPPDRHADIPVDTMEKAVNHIYHKCLSGDIKGTQHDGESNCVPEGEETSASSTSLPQDHMLGNPTSVPLSAHDDRRKQEACQFAEAIGELDSNKIHIIEEDGDGDTDDSDNSAAGTVIRIDEIGSVQDISSVVDPTAETRSHASVNPDIPKEVYRRKVRPQWPFEDWTHQLLLDRLPSNDETDFVYKGIHSNPPEIVKRGIQRGNHVQLHRKAWLEVSDKYHRYGKNLRLYYRHWETLGYPNKMFFDWLDSKKDAAGQPLPYLEECPRAVLDADTVLYITNPEVTEAYSLRLIVNDGRCRLVDVDGEMISTGPEGWIFVLRDHRFYGAQKVTSINGQSKQRFHHSSFFGGKAVACAGIFITDEEGYLTRLYPHSGHYRPGEAHLQRLLYFLHEQGVDLRTFEIDIQQIVHIAREKEDKKKKIHTLMLLPAVHVACFFAHKAAFFGEGIFDIIHKLRRADVTSVGEALKVINDTAN